ncbi:MAG: hemolysin III family protein [Candidatus Marinimicrobia bacterium]|nr:hemolysin III family protein [Candidatus Neomarinimicrobiota bacterium]
MKGIERMGHYSQGEEKFNVISHTIGIILSIVALVFLVMHASLHGDAWHIVTFSIFGVSLILLYTASTLYHSAKKPELRKKLQIFDHAAVYVLIAGSYTPFTLVSLHGTIGWIIFGISWGLALGGIIIKFFFTGKYDLILTIMYVLMGWIIVFALKPLINNLAIEGVLLLFAGGISYTVGALIYRIKKIKFNHAIFHIFVLLGSMCHFIAVYFYVLPR